MTIRVLVCWALCAALVSADDKPKADEVKKPATAAEAVEAMDKVKTARVRSRDEAIANLDKIAKAADAVLAFKDASDEQKDKALVAKAMALFSRASVKPETAKEYDEFVKSVEKEYPNSAAMGTIAVTKFRNKYMRTRSATVPRPAAPGRRRACRTGR